MFCIEIIMKTKEKKWFSCLNKPKMKDIVEQFNNVKKRYTYI